MGMAKERNFSWSLIIILGHLFLFCNAKMEFEITKTWEDYPIDHRPVKIHLERNDDTVTMEIHAPFFNDTPVPTGEAGKPFNKLWDFEVVEAFFLGADEKYLEVEFSPHGQHLLLLLSGRKHAIKMCLPVQYTAEIDGNTWRGNARIPLSYFPPHVNRFNAYAIHGTEPTRQYEALFPVPSGQFPAADFHRLEFFRDVDFGDMLQPNDELSEVWKLALRNEGEGLKCEEK